MTNQEAIALDFYRTGGDHSSHNIPPQGNIKVKYVDWRALQDAWAARVKKLEAERDLKKEE